MQKVAKLEFDKAELADKLESEQKRNGEIVSAGTQQLKLTDSMVCSVRGLIQTKFFQYMPMLDKTMFQQSNLLAPVAKNLGIENKDLHKYSVDIQRRCIEKTKYWREYCGNQVKKEYISKCGN